MGNLGWGRGRVLSLPGDFLQRPAALEQVLEVSEDAPINNDPTLGVVQQNVCTKWQKPNISRPEPTPPSLPCAAPSAQLRASITVQG